MNRRIVKIILGTVLATGIVMAALFVYASSRAQSDTAASPLPALLSYLPTGSPVLVYADLAAIRKSPFYQHRPNKGAQTLPDSDYTRFVESSGFDFERDLDRVAVAGWPAGPNQPKRTIAVAEGRFDQAKIRSLAAHDGKMLKQQGREVFQFPNQDGTGINSMTFLDDHHVAIVEGNSIAPALASVTRSAMGRQAPGALDPARQQATKVSGTAAFAVVRPQAVVDSAADARAGSKSGAGGQSDQLAALARSIQWLTLSADPQGDNMRVTLDGECASEPDARRIQAALGLLRIVAQSGLAGEQTRKQMDPVTFKVVQSMLKNADVSVSASRVRVLMELTPDIFKITPPASTQKNKAAANQ